MGRDSILLKNWRPLTLLNNDNKIYSKALANRLKIALPTIIDSSQTGFIPGRQMSENILKNQEIMSTAMNNKIDGILVSFDFEKAFDTVEWAAIFHALERFNFGPEYIKMVKVLFTDPVTYVMNNGHWSDPIYPMRGARQGCCYSPGAFDLVVEILGIAIRQDKNIQGFEINGNTIKMGPFADDLWATLVGTRENLERILGTIQNFRSFSGLRLNYDKCSILRIGPWRDSNAKFYTMKKLFWSPKSIKILGIFIYPDATVMYSDNFLDLLENVEDILETWKHCALTLFGKIVVIKNLVNTLFIHKLLALLSPPKLFFDTYRRMILKFLWDNKPHRIAYDQLIQGYDKLGFKLVDLATKDTALKAAWPVCIADRGDDIKWFYNTLPIKDERIWSCNMNPKEIERYWVSDVPGDPVPTTSIWKAWSQYNYKFQVTDPEDILDSYLWGNSAITRAGRAIFDKRLVNSNIDKVLDIYDISQKTFLTYDEVLSQFGNVIDPLRYCALRAAIPGQWKIRLRNYDFIEPLDKKSQIEKLNLHKPASKAIYWDLIQDIYPKKILPGKFLWQRELYIAIDDETWSQNFWGFLNLIKPIKLRYLQYRILLCILTTNNLRHKWNPQILEKCTFCSQNTETILHLLVQCPVSQLLWQKLENMLKYFLEIRVTLDLRSIIMNNYNGPQKSMVNTAIIILKQVIYTAKCFNENPNFGTYMNKLMYWFEIEKTYAYQCNKYKKVLEKWSKIFY